MFYPSVPVAVNFLETLLCDFYLVLWLYQVWETEEACFLHLLCYWIWCWLLKFSPRKYMLLLFTFYWTDEVKWPHLFSKRKGNAGMRPCRGGNRVNQHPFEDRQCTCGMKLKGGRKPGHSIVLVSWFYNDFSLLVFIKFIFIGVWFLYNVLLVSTVQQNESAIHTCVSAPFWISFPFRSPQSTEYSSLCYTAGSH